MRTTLESPRLAVSIVAVSLVAVLLSPFAAAQTVQEVQSRDSLIASQEALLNVYRCLFGVDTAIVPGGCADGKPTMPAAEAGPFTGTPSSEEVAQRDVLIANQEALLNVYRCLFDVDTQIVPGGCWDGAPAIPFVPPAEDALFYSGLVAGPDACGELEGLKLYPSDQDGDGVAESCILSDGAVATVPVHPTFTELVSHTDLGSFFDNFTCGLQTDGAIACWGTSRFGVDNPPEGQFSALHVSLYLGCGISIDQTIACWGAFKPSTSSDSSQASQSLRWTVEDMEGRFTDIVVLSLPLRRLCLRYPSRRPRHLVLGISRNARCRTARRPVHGLHKRGQPLLVRDQSRSDPRLLGIGLHWCNRFAARNVHHSPYQWLILLRNQSR